MTFLDRLRIALGRGMVKSMQWPVFPRWATAAFTEPTFLALTREGFRANSAVFACISALAFAYPEPRLRVARDDGEPLPGHGMTALLSRPNPRMGLGQLLMTTITYQAISGNAYWLKVRSRGQRVVELWPLNDAQMQAVSDPQALVSHYDLYQDVGEPKRIDPADVVHFKWMPDPAAPWKGHAPLMAAARDVDTDNETARYLFTLLKNDAIPRVALVFPPEVSLSDEKIERMRQEWQERYGGDNRGKIAFLEGGADVRTLGLDLQQLAFEALRRVPEARIAAAFRVPPIVAGLSVGLERSTFANYAEAVKAFTERTLVPLWRAAESEITAALLPEFGRSDGLRAEFDLGSVVALSEAMTQRREWVSSAVSGGYMTINEARARLGLPRDAGGDVYIRSMAMITEPAGVKALTPVAHKGLRGIESKAQRRRMQESIIAAQRQARREAGGRMEAALNGWFSALADRVIGRLQKCWAGVLERKDALPDPESLITDGDRAELETLVRRYYVELIRASWEFWNLAMGVEVAFDLDDPAVTAVLANAGQRIRDIDDTTLGAIRDALQRGSENGWSIDHIVRGDPDTGVPGLRQIVTETYSGRARTIARTEMGDAQNQAAAGRYAALGVTRVYVMDNGLDDDDEPCKQINGTVQTLEWAQENTLQHPNCTRCFAPEFD